MEAPIPDFASAPRRYDRSGPLRSPFVRPDGSILAEGIATREGILEYPQPDGTVRRELVTRAAVLDTARTLPRSPMTLEHPKSGFVTPDSIREDGVGDVDGGSKVEEDAQGSFVKVKIALRRQDAIDAFNAGVTEVSCGYAVILNETPGEHPIFGHFDASQIGRDCNHFALVPAGRGGPTVSLRADSADAAGHYAAPPTPSREQTMNPTLAALLTALGVERLDDEGAALQSGIAAVKTLRADAEEKATATAEVEKAKEDAEAMAEQFRSTKDALDKAKADAEKLQGEFDALEAKMKEGEKADQARADAAELAELQKLADKVNVDHKDVELPALRLAIAQTRVDSVTDESAAGYVDGILDAIRKDSAARDARYDGDNPTRTDGADKPAGDSWLNNNRQEA